MTLTIFPAIDLKGGQVVRLAEGDMDRATVYGDDSAAQARLFADAGASHLHVVDLDGAFAGTSVNGAAVESIIAAFPGKVQVGGGIRDRAGVDRWLALGVERVIIGTAALKDPEFVKTAARDLPGRIVVGVDAKGGMVATEGWADVSDVRVEDLARRFEDAGVAALLFTDVGRDGARRHRCRGRGGSGFRHLAGLSLESLLACHSGGATARPWRLFLPAQLAAILSAERLRGIGRA